MMAFHRLSFLVVILIFAKQTFQVNNLMSVCQNKKYVKSDTISVNIASTLSSNPYSFSVNYPGSFGSSTPVLGIFLTISDMNINVNSNIYNVSFYGKVNSFSQTSFILTVYSSASSNLASLSYRYTAIALNDQNTFGWILATVTQTKNISSDQWQFSYFATVPLGGKYTLDFPFSNQFAISFLGYGLIFDPKYYFLQVAASIDLDQQRYYPNVTEIKVRILATNNNYYVKYPSQNASITGIYFNILIFNISNDRLLLPYIKGSYSNVTAISSDSSGSYYYVNAISFYNPSTLISLNLTRFSTNSEFTLSISDNFNISSTDSNQQFGVTILWFYTDYCPYSTPYRLNNICYNVCPNDTSTNQSQLSCKDTIVESKNTTIYIENPYQLSPGVSIGSIFGFISFLLVLVLIVATFCLCKKKKKRQNESSQGVQNDTSQAQHIEVIRSYQTLLPDTLASNEKPEIGVWRERPIDYQQQCSICHKKQTNFKTECAHSFHIKCIVTWIQKYDKCPNCRSRQLKEKPHRVLCRFCKEKEKWLSFKDLRQKYRENIHSQEFICPSCIIDPL